MSTQLAFLQRSVISLPRNAIIPLGGIGDGSYATSIEAVQSSDIFISGGISSNCEFEFDIYRQNPALKLVMVDKSVSKVKLIAKGFARVLLGKPNALKYLYNAFIYLWLCQKGIFIPKFIDKNFTLSDVLKIAGSPSGKVFLKLDIEGAEYLLFDEITQLKTSITQLSIEIHDFAARGEEVVAFVNSLSSDLSIVSLSVNNSGGAINGVPNCIELTLVNKAFINQN